MLNTLKVTVQLNTKPLTIAYLELKKEAQFAFQKSKFFSVCDTIVDFKFIALSCAGFGSVTHNSCCLISSCT